MTLLPYSHALLAAAGSEGRQPPRFDAAKAAKVSLGDGAGPAVMVLLFRASARVSARRSAA